MPAPRPAPDLLKDEQQSLLKEFIAGILMYRRQQQPRPERLPAVLPAITAAGALLEARFVRLRDALQLHLTERAFYELPLLEHRRREDDVAVGFEDRSDYRKGGIMLKASCEQQGSPHIYECNIDL